MIFQFDMNTLIKINILFIFDCQYLKSNILLLQQGIKYTAQKLKKRTAKKYNTTKNHEPEPFPYIDLIDNTLNHLFLYFKESRPYT